MTHSGKRAYLWTTLLLVVLLTVVLLWPSERREAVSPVGQSDSTVDVCDTIQPRPQRHARRQSTSRPLAQNYYWPDAPKTEYHSKYDDFKVELNSADTLDLKELRGIGSTFAKRIVKYRDLLGGFFSKEQVKEVYGMSDSLYQSILPHLLVDTQQVTRIDLNTATIDQLKRHPYLDYYQAKAIVRSREKNGNYATVDELLDIALIDQETYNKIKNYITIH